jgi:hypothetical protein
MPNHKIIQHTIANAKENAKRKHTHKGKKTTTQHSMREKKNPQKK